MKKRLLILGLVAMGAIVFGLIRLDEAREGVTIRKDVVRGAPVTVFAGRHNGVAPVIVIAHGFAGSQQMMQPLALTLARSGYVAVTFDFKGHGRNPAPLPGGIADLDKSTRALVSEIGEIVHFARGLPEAGAGLALAGHSMASDLVIRYAVENQGVDAVAAISVFGRDVTPEKPKNLLVIDGAWESPRLVDAGRQIVAAAAGAPPQERVTYGDLEKGTARRLVLARGAEHIGVIYSRDALTETRDWMNAVFKREGQGEIDARGRWLALVFAGVFALAWPASQFLPLASRAPLGAALAWPQLWKATLAPAILTPVILWGVPTDFLPILLGDYLFVHFAVYGALLAAALWRLRGARAVADLLSDMRRAVLPAALAAAFMLVAFGLPLDLYVTSFAPAGPRWQLITLMFPSVAAYFVAEEWLLRGPSPARGGYAFAKFCFVLSLGIAVALNPRRLFFLVIIAIVIVLLFGAFGFLNRRIYERTQDPRVAALAAAAVLAYAIAVTFPIVGP